MRALSKDEYKVTEGSCTIASIPVKDEVWHHIGIDLIGPLPVTPRGCKYTMTVTDYYSKWAEAAPLKNKSAPSVAQFFYSVSLHYLPLCMFIHVQP